MNASIFKNLKNQFISSSESGNNSIIELSITELSSGNFSKAVDISEELIKKDSNDSVGWAIKALSQAYLFDYNSNMFFLKSSLSSLEEFRSKTKLTKKDIIAVEAIFVNTVLNRTISLVNERVNEVIELRAKAKAEKSKAQAAAIGAAMSAYAASKSTSNVGKVFGYGGAAVGVAASAHFNQNAELLNNASKGVFGVAVANISLTVESAKQLKNNLDELDSEIRDEVIPSLQNWINTLSFLYQQVIENLLILAEDLNSKNPFTKSFAESSLNIVNSPEAVQFIYLSNLLGLKSTLPQIIEIEEKMKQFKMADENEIKSSRKSMHLIGGGIIAAGFVFALANEGKEIAGLGGAISVWGGILAYVFFIFKPLGKIGEIKNAIKDFIPLIKNLKVKSEALILENMKAPTGLS